jgi:tripartite-type tricarboxylate transporter receptor subunit TctC
MASSVIARSRISLVVGAALSLTCTGIADAQTPASFYQQNGLRIVVASGAGGGYDTYTRVLQRYYRDHLPGSPNVVIEDMPGAAGLTGTNWA